MRPVLGSVRMNGVVVIGEGEKDEAPMLYNGERVGDGSGPEWDIAVDPVDGTTLTAKSLPDAVSVLGVSPRGTMFDPGPAVYMEKLVVPKSVAGVVDLDAPIGNNLRAIAEATDRAVSELTVAVLDRPRHEEMVASIRRAGARIRFLLDGDVAGAIMAVTPGTGVDLLVGVGGTPEGVLAACALRCLGGELIGRLIARDDDRAPRRPGGRIRPEPDPDHRGPGERGQRVLRRHRGDRRGVAPRRALRVAPDRHPFALDALPVGNHPVDRGPARSRAVVPGQPRTA